MLKAWNVSSPSQIVADLSETHGSSANCGSTTNAATDDYILI